MTKIDELKTYEDYIRYDAEQTIENKDYEHLMGFLRNYDQVIKDIHGWKELEFPFWVYNFTLENISN